MAITQQHLLLNLPSIQRSTWLQYTALGVFAVVCSSIGTPVWAHSETTSGDCHVHMNSGEQHCAADVDTSATQSAEALLPVLAIDDSDDNNGDEAAVTAEDSGSVVDHFQQLEAKSSMIASIQGGLARLGYRPGPATGSINPNTQAAITAFQRDNFLPLSGQPSLSLLTIIEDEVKARTQRHD
ncbi:MAG: peptidoglycan-binding protein [Xanthomonadales bacterium]|nr:peptidoglycan-binding protein [Xanthomonadales bacterium]